jgi:hypothetical protein
MATRIPSSKNISKDMKKLAQSTRKLLDEYKAKQFEYVSYKDFCRLLKNLEDIHSRIEELSNDSN